MTGFVYIWYDRKHKRYYVGSHWGTVDDGYVCSSHWMKRAKVRRPNDFKRRIIKHFDDRQEMVSEERRFLSLIKPEELGKRYYNLNRNAVLMDSSARASMAEKISKKMTGVQKSPEHCHNMRLGRARSGANDKIRGRKRDREIYNKISRSLTGKTLNPFTRLKISTSLKGKSLSKTHRESISKGLMGRTYSPETIAKMAASRKAYWEKRRSG